jgi:hypothetical protein
LFRQVLSGLPLCHPSQRIDPVLHILFRSYSSQSIIYDPVSDHQLSGVQVRKLKQAGIPVELIEPEWARMISVTQRESWPH